MKTTDRSQAITVLSKILDPIWNIGNHTTDDKETIKRIRLTNSIGTSIAAMVFLIAPIYYMIRPDNVMLMAAGIDIMVSLSVLYFNSRGKHLTASLVIYFSQCVAVLAFGLILGGVLQLQFMILFLISIIFLMFKSRFIRNICLVAAILTLGVLQTIYYLNSVSIQPINLGSGYIIQSLALAGVLFLILVVSQPYVSSHDYIPELERANNFRQAFLFQISHELRNSLNQIYLSAGLLRKQTLWDENLQAHQKLIDILNTSCLGAKNIVNNVLSLAQIERGINDPLVYTPFQVKEYMEKVIEVFTLQAKLKGLQIKLAISDNFPSVYADAVKLHELMNNLLGNAIKYADKNSTVYITIGMDFKTYNIQITNKGILDMKKVSELFYPFVTFKKDIWTESTGLGLFIVKDIVDRMKGEIGVSVPMEEHVRFTVTLPFREAKPDEIPITKEDDFIFDYEFNILLAEDNEMNAYLLNEVLKSLKCKVTVTENGQEALAALKRMKPDLIILDSNMPVMGGLETLKALKSNDHYAKIPVVIATADGFDVNHKCFLDAGAEAILTKPIEPGDLAKVIAKHLQRRCDDLLK